jgi:hypothetical protein
METEEVVNRNMWERFAALVSLFVVVAVAIGVYAATAGPVAAQEADAAIDPASGGILTAPTLNLRPPESNPFGLDFGEWGNAWWQWRLAIDAGHDPVGDPTGSECGQNQSGQVWFLAGTNYGTGPTTRTCTVPAGRSLLYPVVNTAYLSWPIDVPWDGGCALYGKKGRCLYYRPTEADVRGLLASTMDGTSGRAASIDGNPVEILDGYRQPSDLFDAWLPLNNLIDPTVPAGFELWGEGDTGPHAQDGWYLMTTSLASPGAQHEIHFEGTFYPDTEWEWTLDVTYDITVGAPE